MSFLEARARESQAAGRKLLVPYVTGGITGGWTDYVLASEQAGADMIEIGLPFSDPMLDGPTIQAASDRALGRGTTVDRILDEVAGLDLSVPVVAMTYANLVFRHGADRFCAVLREAGVTGLIVPDVPIDEVDQLSAAADRRGVALVLLAAPATAPERLREIGKRSRGFVYAVSLMGTTGERSELPDSARELAGSLKQVADVPVLLGFGFSRPDHAVMARRYADGLVVASALMRRVLDGAGAGEVGAWLARMRSALDSGGD